MLAQSGDRQRSGKRRLREGKRTAANRHSACGRGMGRFVPWHEYLSFFVKRKLPKKTTQTYGLRIPWRGEGKCKFGGAGFAELVRWVTLLSVQGSLVPLAPLPLTLCEGRIGCAEGVGDYQIAPIAVLCTAMGRWRLTPPGYGGTCLPAGRSVRGSDRPPACHSIPRTPQGGRLGGAAAGAKNAYRGWGKRPRQPPRR